MLQSLTKLRPCFSVLQAARKYQGSRTQAKMHEFRQDGEQLAAVRSTIDYETMGKQSEGCLMIREFLFQEDKPEYKVNLYNKYLTPTGKWNLSEVAKMLEIPSKTDMTETEERNAEILSNLEGILREKLDKYYTKIGKKNYTFSVKEEIKKIEDMTPEQFEEYFAKFKN